MAKDEHFIFGAERDIPIDLTGGHEDGTQFARFYLERVNQSSNIYFAEQHADASVRAEPVTLKKYKETEASPMSMLWRFAWLCAAGGAIALAVFVIPRIIPVGVQARNADYSGAYEHVLVAQRSVSALALGDALDGFRSARESIAPDPRTTSGAASVIGAAYAFITKNMTPVSSLDAVLADVVDRSAASVAPLADLSFSSFVFEKGRTSAGDSVERAFTEAKNAKAAIENAEHALIVAEENGEDPALRAVLGPQLSLMKANLERYIENVTLASWALGVEYPRRFLIVAQDPHVARATGGVIRSLGVVTTQKGAITDISFNEAYSVDSQIQTNVIPPEPIQKVATAWGIHDANWFLDFPLSAQKIAGFYEKAGGKRIDGVIALNDVVLKNMLAVTGPVAGKGNARVNAESGTVAGDPAALSALMNVLWTLDGEKAREARDVIVQGLAEKDVLVWASDRDHEEAIRAKGWDGGIAAHSNADYLAVVVSDITDAGDAQNAGNVLKETTIDEQGTATHTVVVEFPHAQETADEKLRYLRVYVPRGSRLLEASEGAVQKIVPQIDYAKERFVADEDIADSLRTATRDEMSGVDIYEESGMTVFAMWMPHDEKGSRAVFRYETPVRVSNEGSFTSVFQKQPGTDMALHFSVIAPDGKAISSANGFDGEFHDALVRDMTFLMTIQ